MQRRRGGRLPAADSSGGDGGVGAEAASAAAAAAGDDSPALPGTPFALRTACMRCADSSSA